MAFFGELYYRSTLPFLPEDLTAREVDYLGRAFGQEPPGRFLDLGCGHGRHAAPLASGLARTVVGVELDRYTLERVKPGFAPVRGDLRSLPFSAGTFAGAWAWYSSIFTFGDEENRRVLLEA